MTRSFGTRCCMSAPRYRAQGTRELTNTHCTIRPVIRVLHVCIGYPPATAWGGTTTAAANLATGLAAAGFEVSVATSNLLGKGEPHDLTNETVDGVQVNYLPCISFKSWPGTVGPLFPTPRSVAKIAALVRGADLVHIHGNRQGVGLAAAAAAWASKRPYVIQPHGGVQQILGKRRIKALMDQTIGRALLGRSAAILSLTAAETEQVSRYSATPVTVVPNAVPAPAMRWTGSPAGASDKQILFVGRLNKKKGIDLLIAAMTDPRLSNVRLVVIGADDGVEAELRRDVADAELVDRVDFRGFSEVHATLATMAESDCVVVPSRTDTFPMVIGEAASLGVPLVVSSGCETAAQVQSAGVVVVDPTQADLADGVSRVLSDPVAASAASSELFEQIYSVEGAVAIVGDVYDRIVSGQPD